MKTLERRLDRLEDRLAPQQGRKPFLLVVTDAAQKLALDSDRCIEILHEAVFLPTGRMGIVDLGGIPDGLNAAELEKVPPGARHPPQVRVSPTERLTAILRLNAAQRLSGFYGPSSSALPGSGILVNGPVC